MIEEMILEKIESCAREIGELNGEANLNNKPYMPNILPGKNCEVCTNYKENRRYKMEKKLQIYYASCVECQRRRI